MTEKQIRWQKRSLILYRLKGMVCFSSPEKGVLTPIEIYRLNTAFSIIRKVIQDSVKSSIELGFKDFFTPLQEYIERDSKRPNPIVEEVIRKTYEKHKDILEVHSEK